MIPDAQTEAALVARLRKLLPTMQVVGSRNNEELSLPRVVVICQAGENATLAQAAIFPIETEIQVIYEGTKQKDQIETASKIAWSIRAVQDTRITGVSFYGVVIGGVDTTTEEDRIIRSMNYTIYTRAI